MTTLKAAQWVAAILSSFTFSLFTLRVTATHSRKSRHAPQYRDFVEGSTTAHCGPLDVASCSSQGPDLPESLLIFNECGAWIWVCLWWAWIAVGLPTALGFSCINARLCLKCVLLKVQLTSLYLVAMEAIWPKPVERAGVMSEVKGFTDCFLLNFWNIQFAFLVH